MNCAYMNDTIEYSHYKDRQEAKVSAVVSEVWLSVISTSCYNMFICSVFFLPLSPNSH